MDQLKSNSSSSTPAASQLVVPKRTFNVEFLVGLFAMAGVAASGYLAVGLAGLEIGPADSYVMKAEFDNVSGLKYGASVEIAGVPVGEVTKIELSDPKAIVSLKITNEVRIKDDDILSIRTKGIIGDRYVKVSRGGSDIYIPAGGTTRETESVVDIEDVIGKVIHSLSSDKEEEKDKEQK
jgi:phospholipid/cholesterol/gamma-HCH transport system substrate-binding protein